MKRKMFILLLAIAALSVFRTNAQSIRANYWLLADTSGLAKNALLSDSFPNNKLGLYNWLTVDGDSLKVHPQDTVNPHAIYEDGNSRFDLAVEMRGFIFNINRAGNTSDSFSIGATADFVIGQFPQNGTGTFPANPVPTLQTQQFDKDTIEGYLVRNTGSDGADSGLWPYNPNLALAGVNKQGEISFKDFSEFAAHADSLPASSCLSYQFNEADIVTDTFVTGRLYQSDEYPFFQTYFRKDSALVSIGGEPINWSRRNKDQISEDSIYTYYNFKYVSDNNAISIGDEIVRLDTIVNYVIANGLSGIDTASVNTVRDSLLYFQVDEANNITFTAYIGEEDEEEAQWTNNKPDTFTYGQDNRKVLYYIDARETTRAIDALKKVLADKFGVDTTFTSATNQIERYIYKENDDWHPLYVKAVPSCDSLPYEYVTSQWLKEKHYDIAAVSQEIVGVPGASVSADATIIKDGDKAQFLFEYAATIRSEDSTVNGVGKFSNDTEIELFYIRHSGKYLTVLNTTIFTGSTTDSTVTNTQLGWEDKIAAGADELRQAFAIVYNSEDSSILFLPVASYQSKGATPQYGTTLQYNTAIGKKSQNTCGDWFIDISESWYITQLSKTGDLTQRLIIADPGTATNREIIRFNVTTNYELAEVGKGCHAFAIYDATGEFYYPVEGEKVEGTVTDGMFRHHWTVRKIKENEVIPEWIFTPEIDSIYGVKVEPTYFTDTFIALQVSDDLIELISGTKSPYRRDTIEVRCTGHSLPFLNLDPYVGVSKRVAILDSFNDDRYITFNDTAATDSVHKAVYTVIDDKGDPDTYTRLIVYKSVVQHLGKNGRHQVPYYAFSYKNEDGDEYFLSAQDSVRWVRLEEPEITELLAYWEPNNKLLHPSFKFCLPYTDGENHYADTLRFKQPVYLQTLHSSAAGDYSLINFEDPLLESVKLNEVLTNNSEYIPAEGIYSAVDQYKNITGISSWRFHWKDEITSGWMRINAADTVSGVFTNVDNFAPGTVFVVPSSETPDGTEQSEVNYGVLTGVSQDQDVELTLIYKGGAQIGYEKDSIWYYNIKYKDLYLTDAVDSVDTVAEKGHDNEYEYKYFNTEFPYAFFTQNKLAEHPAYRPLSADSAFRQTFALQRVKPDGDRDNFEFLVVSSADYTALTPAYRYLNRLDSRLVFVDDNEDGTALKFQWGKVDNNGSYTDIKVIGAPAAIYGIAGGVKTVNAVGEVAIYTIDGRLVTVRAVVSPNQTIAVPAGIYIVRNGASVVKVVVK